MSEQYEILYQEHVSAEEEEALLEGVIQAAAIAKGMSRIRPFAFLDQTYCKSDFGWGKRRKFIRVSLRRSLWVAPELRHQGLGSKLIHACENLGRERGCAFVTLTTMDWEALPFYQKLGYEIEFVREGYEKNSKMYALRKGLK